jgi:hypothetical protein
MGFVRVRRGMYNSWVRAVFQSAYQQLYCCTLLIELFGEVILLISEGLPKRCKPIFERSIGFVLSFLLFA